MAARSPASRTNGEGRSATSLACRRKPISDAASRIGDRRRPLRRSYPWIDVGIAGERLVLQATELGLGTCWIGWIRPKTVRRIVGWPAAIRPAALITVGWPSDESTKGPKPRLPLSDIVQWLDD